MQTPCRKRVDLGQVIATISIIKAFYISAHSPINSFGSYPRKAPEFLQFPTRRHVSDVTPTNCLGQNGGQRWRLPNDQSYKYRNY